MVFLPSAFIGFFFGFALGVGSALAVMYSIYSGGYRKAVEDSLRPDKPERFLKLLTKSLNLNRQILSEEGRESERLP